MAVLSGPDDGTSNLIVPIHTKSGAVDESHQQHQERYSAQRLRFLIKSSD